MNDNDYNILDVWLSGEGTVRASNAVSNPDKYRHTDTCRLSIIISGRIDTNAHPWAKTFKKIDVTLCFSDENPADDRCAFVSASAICLEGDVVYRDSLNIEAFLPTASFTIVSQILTSSRTGRPVLFLLTDDDVAAWAAKDEPNILKVQECAFDYDTHTLAALDEHVHKVVAEQPEVDTAPRRWGRRRKQNVEAPVSGSSIILSVVLIAAIIVVFLATFFPSF